MNKQIILAIMAGIFFSCNNDISNDEPLGSYDNGILVLNEGSAVSGSVTYISDDLLTVQPNVFGVVNGDSQSIGGFVQSIFFDGNRAFIISNGSNKITVVNRYTFEYIATINTGLAVPRYGVVHNGRAYVTNMNSFGTETDDFVAVINLGDLSLAAPISVGDYAERITAANGKIYVTNGSFGSGNKVTIINPDSATVENTITVGISPNSMEAYDGTLYVLCGSFSENSKIVKINMATNQITEVTMPAAMVNAQNLDVENGNIYFSVGPKVYKVGVDATSISDSPLFDTESSSAFIGYGFGVNGDRVYISEAANDFSSDGKIFVYTTTGAFIDDIPVGLGPNGFYFNN